MVAVESLCGRLRVTPALPSILREAWLRSSLKRLSPDKRAKALRAVADCAETVATWRIRASIFLQQRRAFAAIIWLSRSPKMRSRKPTHVLIDQVRITR